MRIAIVTDTSSGLNNEQVNKDDIYVLPIPYVIDGTPYTDNQSYQDFINEINNGKKFAKTSQVAIGVVELMYEELLLKYDYIIHLPISSALSSTCATAVSVAAKFGGRVKVVDQLKVATLLGNDVRHAARLAKEGKSVDEIIESLKSRYDDNVAYIIPFNLTTLKNGGRINAATAALGNLIGIKPIIELKNGKLDQYGKERAIIKAYKVCLKAIMNVFNPETQDLYILHCNEEYRAKEFGSYVEKEVEGIEVKYDLVPISIAAHTGPGTLAIGIVDKI